LQDLLNVGRLGMFIEELETPAAVVDLDILQVNIGRLQKYLDGHSILNRPHIKTHKVPEIAHLQIAAGAIGITCQKLSEAEVMAQAGIQDIFVPYNILGEIKLERLRRLHRRVSLSVTADSRTVVQGLSEALHQETKVLPVLVEFDTGLKRCGVQTPSEAAELAETIERSKGIRFAGLMTYPTNQHTRPFVTETRTLLSAKGIEVEQVSGGGTHCMWEAHTHGVITEHRAGMYVYGDRKTVRSGALKLEECSFRIHTTVVSRPTTTRGILDAGSKCLASDLVGPEDGYGLIVEYPEAKIYALSEEHGHVDFAGCEERPDIGERVTVLTNHCCVANNLFDKVYGASGGVLVVEWPVLARGAVH
jgi:D-serine deaminase-like pyridoxal phosphate-dependent protein